MLGRPLVILLMTGQSHGRIKIGPIASWKKPKAYPVFATPPGFEAVMTSPLLRFDLSGAGGSSPVLPTGIETAMDAA